MKQLVPASSRFCFIASLAASSAFLLLDAVKWWFISSALIFVIPVIFGILFVILVAALIWAIVEVIRKGRSAAAPLLLCAVTLALWWFVPVDWIWTKAYDRFYRSERDLIVTKISDGTLKPNMVCCPAIIALGSQWPNVSMGGNEVMVERHDGKTYALFFTFRGILSHYSGLLFVPDGGDPTHFRDLDEQDRTEIVALRKHWYWIAHD